MFTHLAADAGKTGLLQNMMGAVPEQPSRERENERHRHTVRMRWPRLELVPAWLCKTVYEAPSCEFSPMLSSLTRQIYPSIRFKYHNYAGGCRLLQVLKLYPKC